MSFIYRFFKNIFIRNNRVHINLNRENNDISNRRNNIIVRPIDPPIINNYVTSAPQQPVRHVVKHKCRYCYMDNFQNSLIAPCKCSGSVKYVHIYCLERWRRIKNNPSRCEICNKKYKIPRNRVVKTYRRFLNRQERIINNRNRTQRIITNRTIRNNRTVRNVRNRSILRTIYGN